jgi:hypothetical protein
MHEFQQNPLSSVLSKDIRTDLITACLLNPSWATTSSSCSKQRDHSGRVDNLANTYDNVAALHSQLGDGKEPIRHNSEYRGHRANGLCYELS